MAEQSEAYKKLVAILEELFQLDQADLDFGIYRIMNQKRREITDFLEKQLLKQISETMEQTGGEDQKDLEEKLKQTEQTLRDAGVDPDSNERVQEMRSQLASPASKQAMENEVYSHLTNFFRRYYKDGDFISQRRYKEDVYAIPYEGEEVKLYWANHDQYYIKTSEYFKDFRFTLPNGRKVHFRLRDASTDKDNNKSQSKLERRFILAESEIYDVEENELNIYFTYELVKKTLRQDKLMEDAFRSLKEALPQEWLQELLLPRPTEKHKDRTLLEKYLKDYTARNTFDYFIHKDLGKFLNRELDFFIKNEILHIDDINLDSEQDFQQQLRIVKALKGVARKLIAFLTQLEDFQRKLWLKKKFVIQSDYCITLDRIDESFYEDITANDAQRKEWVRLFAIDELDGYSESLTVDFLKQNPYLQVDTQFFSREWKYKLLASIDHLDEQSDGLLVNSENLQALNLLQRKYQEAIQTIYIDPPYNTDASEIIYKNGFKISSWNSLIQDRLITGRKFLSKEGILCITIDDFQFAELSFILEKIFFESGVLGVTPIRNNPSGRPIPTGFAIAHEYGLYVGKSETSKVGKLQRTDKQNQRYKETDEIGSYMWELLRKRGSDSERSDSPKAYFPIYYNESTNSFRIPDMEWIENEKTWNIFGKKSSKEIVLLPIDENNIERRWRWGYERIKNSLDQLKVEKNGSNYTVYYRYRPPEGAVPITFWGDKRYSSTEHGTGKLKPLFKNYNPFSYPKSIFAVQDSIIISGANDINATILDYFAGSGTTAHAVINLNREDDGNRKYILVEMGEYFNSVTKPRVQKVAYSKEWKNGKPTSREGISHCFKYMRLESYEDTLNNLELKRNEQQSDLLSDPDLREEYILHYLLDVESRGSLLRADVLRKPFGYTIKTTEQNEQKEAEVDLVETFNYLIGLTVDSMQLIRDFVVVTGQNPEGEKVLIIWRDLDKHDNAALNELFEKMQFSTRDSEFDRIYVNGDNNLQNLQGEEESWKVSLIEEEFHKRMFDVQEL